jgi:hypothetical protein
MMTVESAAQDDVFEASQLLHYALRDARDCMPALSADYLGALEQGARVLSALKSAAIGRWIRLGDLAPASGPLITRPLEYQIRHVGKIEARRSLARRASAADMALASRWLGRVVDAVDNELIGLPAGDLEALNDARIVTSRLAHDIDDSWGASDPALTPHNHRASARPTDDW